MDEPNEIVLGPDRPEEVVCDFCIVPLNRETVWTYPCESFRPSGYQIPGRLIQTSVTDWAACEACHALIEQQAWDALAKRSVDHFPERAEMSRAHRRQTMKQLKTLYLEFSRHRRGPPYQMPPIG